MPGGACFTACGSIGVAVCSRGTRFTRAIGSRVAVLPRRARVPHGGPFFVASRPRGARLAEGLAFLVLEASLWAFCACSLSAQAVLPARARRHGAARALVPGETRAALRVALLRHVEPRRAHLAG